MMSFKAWIILGCVISVIEFSVGNRNVLKRPKTEESAQSDIDEDKRETLVRALSQGEMTMVKKLIADGVLEEYYHGIYDKQQSAMLMKIEIKVGIISKLLKLKLVSIPNIGSVHEEINNKRLFNVSLIPGTDLSVSLLVNLTAVKDESLANKGDIPLHIICALPDVEPEVVKIFLDFGTVGIDTWSDSGMTALIIAIARGNLDLVKFLVENGAAINNNVTSMLENFIELNHQYDQMILFNKESVFFSDIDIPKSALVAATYQNQPVILKYILENGGKVNKEHSWFLLLKPSIRNFKEVVETLLENGIDVNSKGPFGSTTLHRVVGRGNTEMTKFLLMFGADSNLTNNFGWTPLHVAALLGGNNTTAIVELLLDSGCDANALTDNGFSPLNLVEAGCDLNFLDYLERNPDSLKFEHQIRKGNLREPKACDEHTEAMELLVNGGADVNHQDDIFGWTALHWAAANGNLKGAKILVEKYGASTILRSKMGITPFGTAKHFGRNEVLEYLNTIQRLDE